MPRPTAAAARFLEKGRWNIDPRETLSKIIFQTAFAFATGHLNHESLFQLFQQHFYLTKQSSTFGEHLVLQLKIAEGKHMKHGNIPKNIPNTLLQFDKSPEQLPFKRRNVVVQPSFFRRIHIRGEIITTFSTRVHIG